MIRLWRRIDLVAIERLAFDAATGVARGTIVSTEHGGFELAYRWRIDGDRRTQSVVVASDGADGSARVDVARAGNRWLVDGRHRSELDGCAEVDLSVTPFCNTLPLRLLEEGIGATVTIDTVFIDAADLAVRRSRQQYERLAPDRVIYRDLGLFDGFEAELAIDADAFVMHYEGLFEVLDASPE